MKIYKKLKPFISLVCTLLIIFSMVSISVGAVDANSVTASTSATVKQGNSAYCYVDIASTEGLAALDVTVHFDPAKVKILGVYNSISCTLYDSVTNTDNIQFSYILDGEGSASKTRLFYFRYQVLSNADVGSSYFDITIGEAYDNSLNDVAVSGSRCNFTIAETITNKTCSVYSSSSMSTSIEQEFTISYRFSTYQIASGTAVITYDPEMFEVTGVTNGAFLTNKVVDVNASLSGEVYISFVGTEYYSNTNFVSVTFKTIKNVTDTSKIVFKAVELIDKELNSISCSGYTTNVNVAFDSTYVGDAPAMKLDGTFSYDDMQIALVVTLEANSRLGAGDFVITFDPELVSYNSCTKGFTPSFFNINDKKAQDGELKFHIISLSDITTEETVLTVVFDVKQPYSCETADFTLVGTGLTDSLTEGILLNFIDDSVFLEYKITFCDEDGTILQSGMYHYGDVVTEPDAPTKESDVYGKYIFNGWDKTVVPCASEEVYTATYNLEYTDYVVVFKNWDDSVISRKTYHYGETVEEPETPVKEKDDYYKYNFDRWDKDVVTCSGDAEYKAIFTAEHYHTYSKTVIEPTCTEQGYTTYTCKCGNSYVGDYEDALNHIGGTANCKDKAICTRCKKAYGDIDTANHKTIVTDKAVDATCTATGLTEGSHCDACGKVTVAQTTTDKLKHEYTSEITTQPTHVTDGVKTYTCVCGNSYTEVVEKLKDHKYNPVVTAPTCTEQGYTTYTCICGESYIADYVEENGHSFTNYISDGKATCVTDGYKVAKCDNCDATDSIEEKGEHKFSDSWTMDTEPTCSSVGYKSHHCVYCDEKKDVTTIDKLAHTYSITNTPPTCTNKGSNTYTCGCGYTYTETIEAKGHDFDGSVCKNCGFDKAASCSCNCHKSGIAKIIFKIILIFQKIFKTNKQCDCGAYHY